MFAKQANSNNPQNRAKNNSPNFEYGVGCILDGSAASKYPEAPSSILFKTRP